MFLKTKYRCVTFSEFVVFRCAALARNCPGPSLLLSLFHMLPPLPQSSSLRFPPFLWFFPVNFLFSLIFFPILERSWPSLYLVKKFPACLNVRTQCTIIVVLVQSHSTSKAGIRQPRVTEYSEYFQQKTNFIYPKIGKHVTTIKWWSFIA